MIDLNGHAVIVSGNGEDLGHAITTALVQQGAKVALVDEVSDERDALVTRLSGGGADVTAIDVDFTDADSTQRAARQALEAYGTPRALVHTAARFREISVADLTFADWRTDLDIIAQSAFVLAHTVWPAMTSAGAGSIVFVSSGSALAGFADEAPYVAGKHAQEGLMKVLALEGKPLGVAANTMTTGIPIDGPLAYTYSDAMRAVMVKPSELAPAFVWAAGLDPAGATGQRLNAFQLSNALRDGAKLTGSHESSATGAAQ